MLTSTDVGPPTGLSMRAWPPAARTRLTMPSRPPPAITRAPPTPLSSTRAQSDPASRSRTTTRHLGAARVLRRVGEGLGDREVGGGLGIPAAASVEADVEVHGDDRATRERRQRRVEAAIVEDGGVDAAGELPQLGDGRLRRGVRLGDERLARPPGRRRSSAARGPGSCRPRRAGAARRRGGRARCACARRRRRGPRRRAGRSRCAPPRRAAPRGRGPGWPASGRRAGCASPTTPATATQRGEDADRNRPGERDVDAGAGRADGARLRRTAGRRRARCPRRATPSEGDDDPAEDRRDGGAGDGAPASGSISCSHERAQEVRRSRGVRWCGAAGRGARSRTGRRRARSRASRAPKRA